MVSAKEFVQQYDIYLMSIEQYQSRTCAHDNAQQYHTAVPHIPPCAHDNDTFFLVVARAFLP